MPDMTDRGTGRPPAGNGAGRSAGQAAGPAAEQPAGGRGSGPVRLAGAAGLGTAPFGSGPGWELDWGPASEQESVSAIRAALAAGVGWVDTAPFYGWGRAERAVGRALVGTAADGGAAVAVAAAGPGGRAALLTKCGTLRGADGRSYEDHRAAAIRADLDASLSRLGCSSVDVLQLHDPDPGTPVESAWETIHALIAAGLARGGGLSSHPVTLMDRALKVGPVDVVQQQYSLLHRAPERTGVLAWCTDHDAAFLAWSPLASGFLADGFDVAALGRRDFRRQLPWSGGALAGRLGELRHALAGIGADTGLAMSALAVGWVLAKGAKAIIGARNPAEAAAIAGYRALAPDVAAAVEAAAGPFAG